MTKMEMNIMIMKVEIMSVIQEHMRPTIASRTKDIVMNIQYMSNFLFFR